MFAKRLQYTSIITEKEVNGRTKYNTRLGRGEKTLELSTKHSFVEIVSTQPIFSPLLVKNSPVLFVSIGGVDKKRRGTNYYSGNHLGNGM